MTERSVFTDEEWRHITDAPVLINLAMVAAGQHGPISMVKESMASAKALARPGDHGSANILISEIAQEAKGKQARHDAKAHKGATVEAIIDLSLEDLKPAADALYAKLPADEAREIGGWLADTAQAVAEAAKGVTPQEQRAVDRIRDLFVRTSG